MIFVLDNYDSFTYNLVHLLYAIAPEIVVKRNREISAAEVLAMKPEAVVLSPGPGRPAEAGCMEELIAGAAGIVPMLGVCLGHQAIAETFGGKIVSARHIIHGKTSCIRHDGQGIFQGLRQDFKAVRYHSLAVEESSLPACFTVSARSEDGEIMGLRHNDFPIEGVQYHPESILTAGGRRQLENFMEMARAFQRSARKEGVTC